MRWMMALLVLAFWGCKPPPPPALSDRPALLLITLDTTRADYLGYAGKLGTSPNLDRLAASGRVFTLAYSAVPETLPSHVTMMTGLYPAAHGIHENGRALDPALPLLAPALAQLGYRTAAFVSAFPVSRGLGLERGFAVYDDDYGSAQERSASATTARALAWLKQAGPGPLFLWVHYFDPHAPYQPPEPFASRFHNDPYAGEIAAMDAELGRLVEAFRAHSGAGQHAILVAGDHGEGLGDHGEAQHGNLLYSATSHVPLLLSGTGMNPARLATPVSLRRVRETLLGLAQGEAKPGLCGEPREVVVVEAMKPYLSYGWSPQVAAISGTRMAIRAGELELYDLIADPAQTNNLAPPERPLAEQASTLRDYPLPNAKGASQLVREEDLAKLQSLGYSASPGLSEVAGPRPIPARMTELFPLLDAGSAAFASSDYKLALQAYAQVLTKDPYNLTVHLRQAVAHGMLNHDKDAEKHFARARALSPESADVRHYLAMYQVQRQRWDEAADNFTFVLARQPRRFQALSQLAFIRERQGRLDDAQGLFERALSLDDRDAETHLALTRLAMERGRSAIALEHLLAAKELQGQDFSQHLELGACFMDLRRFDEAAPCFDLVPQTSPAFPLALFKRAQLAALRHESDLRARYQAALRGATPETRPLLERDPLFAELRD